MSYYVQFTQLAILTSRELFTLQPSSPFDAVLYPTYYSMTCYDHPTFVAEIPHESPLPTWEIIVNYFLENGEHVWR